MQVPGCPINESQRLQALWQLNLLDTPSEDRFDRLTRLAAELFDVPIALVSLVDQHRQWFKSKFGLDACETGRDISFCGHTILGQAIFEVIDASLDLRFADNPLVTGAPHIRFYAGAPLMTVDGYCVGTLCLIDSKARQLSPSQRHALRDLADAVESEISRIALFKQGQQLKEIRQLSEAITRVQLQFIREQDKRRAFDELLADVLRLTQSEYGFIGEVLYTPANAPYIKMYAITNIAWDETTQRDYEAHAAAGMEFVNLHSLFGAALTSGEPVIANDPTHDPRSGGLPSGHAALNAFLGIPIEHGGKLVAMLGLANRPGGYQRSLIDFLSPLLLTIAQLIVALRVQQQLNQDRLELERLSWVASQTTHGVLMTDIAGCVLWANEGFSRLTGYRLDELKGRKPGHVLQGPASDPLVVAQMRQAMAAGQGFEVEIINYTKNQQPFWNRICCSPLHDTQGVLVGFSSTESDITREKQDAERIRASERRLAAVIEGTNIGTWEWNVQSGETVFNERWADIIGYRLLELGPVNIQTWLNFAHPEDLKASADALQKHFAGEQEFYDVMVRMQHKNGHWVWVHDRGRVVSWTDDGKPLLMSGTHADITEQKQAEEALRESEQQFRSLVNNIPGITYRCLLDQHWTMLYMSNQIDPLTGYPADDFIHNAVRSYASVIHPDDTLMTEQAVNQAIESGQDFWDIEYRVLHRDGSVRWVQERGSAVRTESGQVDYLDGFVLDINAAKQAEQALRCNEARLRGLFELSPIGIALNEYDTGAFVELNEALVKPTGYSREQFVKLSYWDITPREYEPQEMAQLDSMQKNGRYGPYEKEYIRKDGSRYPVLLNGMVVYDNSGRKLIWSIVEDISERKRNERMKNEFISTVSHELRTPLTVISGTLKLMLGGVVAALPSSAVPMLEMTLKNSLRLEHLVNDLLDMEKLLAGKMVFDFKIQALMPLLEQAVVNNAAYAQAYQASLQLKPAEDVLVNVDALRFQQILANLISNAAKFSPAGGVVLLTVAQQQDGVRIAVRDQGPGIPLSFQSRIFEKFSQADSSDTRQKGGSGLGLAITRQLVERMGGQIGFQSTPAQGTTFYVDLPLANHAD